MQSQAGKHFVVIGGGISGLASAFEVQKRLGPQDRLTLLEAGPQLGGVIQTSEHDGCILDEGPDCFITTKPEAMELCRELGIESELMGTSAEHRRSFIVHQGKLHPIPEGFFLLAPTSFKALAKNPLLSWPGKLRAAMEAVIPVKRDNHDESLDSFVRRRFGNELMERIAQPMVAGIYTADPTKLSLRATFPHFLEMEQQHGSVIRALLKKQKASPATDGAQQAAGPRYGMFVSFKKGMGFLIDALKQALARSETRGELRCNTPVSSVVHGPTGWQIKMQDGEQITADGVILALPTHASARLLGEGPLSQELKQIPYASSAIATLAFDRSKVSHQLNGMGFVVPEIEHRPILAGSFSSVKWPGRSPADIALFRVFIGGALHEDLLIRSDEELLELARGQLELLVGAKGKPRFTMLRRWTESMCQYHVGHKDLVVAIREEESKVPALALAGNGFDGVGIPDCVRNARSAVERLFAKLA